MSWIQLLSGRRGCKTSLKAHTEFPSYQDLNSLGPGCWGPHKHSLCVLPQVSRCHPPSQVFSAAPIAGLLQCCSPSSPLFLTATLFSPGAAAGMLSKRECFSGSLSSCFILGQQTRLKTYLLWSANQLQDLSTSYAGQSGST